MGKSSERGELAFTLAGVSVWLVLVLFRGFSLEWTALPLAAAAVASLTGTPLFFPGFVILLASVFSLSGPGAAAAAGIYTVLVSPGLKGRLLGVLSVIPWLSGHYSPEAATLVAALMIPVFLGSFRIRAVVSTALFIAVLLFLGPPGPVASHPVPARCFLREGHAWWTVESITLANPEAILAPPVPAPFSITLEMDCGGIRDSLPMALLIAGENTVELPEGTHTVSLELTGSDSIFVTLIRGHSPFNHPVIHIKAVAEW